MTSAPRYGLVSYADTRNVGDDIQTLAARQYLPRVDQLLDREHLDRVPAGDMPTTAILNGWFMHRPTHWPPAAAIRPLLISMHLAGSRRSRFFWPPHRTAAEILLAPARRDYFQRHGPVGARDTATLAALRRAGVESYFSGCLTLTLTRPDAGRGDDIVACDLPATLLRPLATRFGERLRVVTHALPGPVAAEERVARALALLDLYASARAVVTTRVHCALPCLALGTPVLYIPQRSDIGRKGVATELTHHTTAADWLGGRFHYDPDAPPANPERHLPLAEELGARCRAFISAA